MANNSQGGGILFSIGFSSRSSARFPKTQYQQTRPVSSSRSNMFSIGFYHFIAKTCGNRCNHTMTRTSVFFDIETLTKINVRTGKQRHAIIVHRCTYFDRFHYAGVSLTRSTPFVSSSHRPRYLFSARESARQQLTPGLLTCTVPVKTRGGIELSPLELTSTLRLCDVVSRENIRQS